MTHIFYENVSRFPLGIWQKNVPTNETHEPATTKPLQTFPFHTTGTIKLPRALPCAQSCCWSQAGSSGWWHGRGGGPGGRICPWCSLPNWPTVPLFHTQGTRGLAYSLARETKRGPWLAGLQKHFMKVIVKTHESPKFVCYNVIVSPVLGQASSCSFSVFPSVASLSTSLKKMNTIQPNIPTQIQSDDK